MQTQAFKTNDILQISMDSLTEGAISINGIPLRLKTIETLVLYVLAEHGRGASSFLPVAEIIASVHRLRGRGRILAGSDVEKVDIYKALDSLREKFSAQQLNPSFLEGKRGRGYMLSTPRCNLVLNPKPVPHDPSTPL